MRIGVLVYGIMLSVGSLGWADGDAQHAPSTPGERPMLMLKQFPEKPEAYAAPAADLIKQGIPDKFGHEEWVAVVLTHEVHHHVGVYSIIGAKMGVRAREILGAPMRSVRVAVETGEKPPLSCMADGLQVALGSTLGQGLIRVPETHEPRVAATFEYQGKSIRLELTPKLRADIDNAIQSMVKEHGNLTPEYFRAVERFSYRFWTESDRRTMFIEQTVK